MAFRYAEMKADSLERFRQDYDDLVGNTEKKALSNKRACGAALSLLLGLFLAYCSFFYIPAFTNSNQVIGYSTLDAKMPQIDGNTADKLTLTPYVELFKIRRGFFRAGQAINVHFDLDEDQVATLQVKKCNAAPIVEVFVCNSFTPQVLQLENVTRGSRDIIITEPGFYHFDELIMMKDGTENQKPFVIAWSRT